MEITLTAEQQKVVKRLVASGAYESEIAVLDEVLRVLEDYDPELLMPREAVKASLREAADQLRRGEGRSWNLDEFLARARERRATRQRSGDHA